MQNIETVPPVAPVESATTSELKRIHALPTRFQELDGWRGICALLVVAFHYSAGPAAHSTIAGRLHTLLYVFPIHVESFFVLSGFLVGGILLNTKFSPNYFKTFYMRRLYRVAPVYYVWIAAFVLLALCVPSARKDLVPAGFGFSPYVAAHVLFLQNFPHFPFFASKAEWFGTTWSLAIEEHFYLIIPFCVYRFSRRSLIAGLSAIIVLVPLARVFAYGVLDLRDPWGVTYVWTPFRADSLATGVLLAILWQNPEMNAWFRRHLKWICACLAVSTPVAAGLNYMWLKNVRHAGAFAMGFGGPAVFLASVCVILLALIFQGHKNFRILRWSWARAFGKISYFIYLAHRGILWFVLRFIFHTQASLNLRSDVFGSLTALVLVSCLGFLSWHYMESPVQRRAHRFVY